LPQKTRAFMEKEFGEIFSGLKRNFGIAYLDKFTIDPNTGKKKPERYGWSFREITDKDYSDHLKGKTSIGIQPCDDEGMVSFGAIDIDDKEHSYSNFPYKKYLDIIKTNNLPLIPVKSKSGGLHLYLFLKEKVRAVFLRNFLEGLLFTLKLKPNTEIYPKQTELGYDEEKKEYSNGQYINLPYFNGSERIAINYDGTPFTLEQFIKVVDHNKKTKEELEEFSLALVKTVLQGGSDEFIDGPPCLQISSKEELTDGRDRWLYNYMVFAKKKYPDNWQNVVKAAPQKYFIKDATGVVLDDWGSEKKIMDKVKSWRKDSTKGYSCTQEPIVNFCIKVECLKRKYGVGSDRKRMFPPLSNLIKINYPEPEYTFNVELPDNKGSKAVRAKDIKQIKDQEELRSLIMKTANIYVAKIKGDDFENVISKLLPPVEIHQPPKGTTPDELLHEYLEEYLNGPKAKSYASFKSGAVLVEDGYAFFKFANFFNTLKNKEWREGKERTAQRIKEKYKAEFGVKKRFPKLNNETTNYEAIETVKINLMLEGNEFIKDIAKTELVKIKGNKDVF
jgi:hypothetical protein